jgi:multiple sugar transport system ATP-binding protein
MAEVVLDKIQKTIGGAPIIAELTLTVRDGEFFTLLGPSGCGKSTILHLIAGLDHPTSGRLRFDGDDVTDLTPRERDVAMVFQTYALYPHMTVSQNLSFPLRVGRRRALESGKTIPGEVARVAALLGLEGLLDRRPRELSGGQRQRVALGRAIIRRPRVFLLDEPLSNLDPQLRGDMRAELRRLHDDLGVTMIYVTHDQTEAMTLADRIAVLERGHVQQVGRPNDLYATPRNLFVGGFIGHPAMNTWEAAIEHGKAVAGPLQISVPSDVERRYAGKTMVVGARPEDVRVCATGTTVMEAGASAPARVSLVEPTGGQTWITADARLGDGKPVRRLVGLGERNFEAKPGEPVTLSIAHGVTHLFDRDTGLRVASIPFLTTERSA